MSANPNIHVESPKPNSYHEWALSLLCGFCDNKLTYKHSGGYNEGFRYEVDRKTASLIPNSKTLCEQFNAVFGTSYTFGIVDLEKRSYCHKKCATKLAKLYKKGETMSLPYTERNFC